MIKTVKLIQVKELPVREGSRIIEIGSPYTDFSHAPGMEVAPNSEGYKTEIVHIRETNFEGDSEFYAVPREIQKLLDMHLDALDAEVKTYSSLYVTEGNHRRRCQDKLITISCAPWWERLWWVFTGVTT